MWPWPYIKHVYECGHGLTLSTSMNLAMALHYVRLWMWPWPYIKHVYECGHGLTLSTSMNVAMALHYVRLWMWPWPYITDVYECGHGLTLSTSMNVAMALHYVRLWMWPWPYIKHVYECGQTTAGRLVSDVTARDVGVVIAQRSHWSVVSVRTVWCSATATLGWSNRREGERRLCFYASLAGRAPPFFTVPMARALCLLRRDSQGWSGHGCVARLPPLLFFAVVVVDVCLQSCHGHAMYTSYLFIVISKSFQ